MTDNGNNTNNGNSRGNAVERCQWPACRNLSSHMARRGEVNEFMRLCDRHLRAFHLLTNADAANVHANWQPRQRLRVQNRGGRVWYTPLDHYPELHSDIHSKPPRLAP